MSISLFKKQEVNSASRPLGYAACEMLGVEYFWIYNTERVSVVERLRR